MKRATITLAAAAGFALTLSSCSGAEPPPPPVTITETAPAVPTAPSSAVPAPVEVVLPEVEGRNLQLVSEELTELGLMSVDFASQDVEDKVVLLPQNWTATSIEPAPGTTVMSTDTVIVTATKE